MVANDAILVARHSEDSHHIEGIVLLQPGEGLHEEPAKVYIYLLNFRFHLHWHSIQGDFAHSPLLATPATGGCHWDGGRGLQFDVVGQNVVQSNVWIWCFYVRAHFHGSNRPILRGRHFIRSSIPLFSVENLKIIQK